MCSSRAMAILHNREGVRLYREGDFDGAATELRAAIKWMPNNPFLRDNLGSVLRAKGDLTGAIAEFLEALSLNPKMAETRNKLGFIFFERGDIRSAVGQWQAAVTLYPHLSEAWAGWALALSALGQQERAVHMYRRALRQNGRYADIPYLREHHGWSSAAIRQAEAILRAVRESEPKVSL